MADVQANANSEHEVNTDGEENTQNTVAESTQEELKLDFEKSRRDSQQKKRTCD